MISFAYNTMASRVMEFAKDADLTIVLTRYKLVLLVRFIVAISTRSLLY